MSNPTTNKVCELCYKPIEKGILCPDCSAKSQKNVKEVSKLQHLFGGYKPEYINMYFAKKLEKLTKVLIALTVMLGIIAVLQIVLLVSN